MNERWKPEYLAKEAERLQNDPVLLHALQEMVNEALLTLSRADPDNKTEILRWQQTVAVCNDLMDKLGSYILSLPEQPDHPV